MPSSPALACLLHLRDNHGSFFGALPSEFPEIVVRGFGHVLDQDRPSDPVRPNPRVRLQHVERVRDLLELVSLGRNALDRVPLVAERLDLLPDRGPRDLEFLADRLAGDVFLRSAQEREDSLTL